VGAELFHVDGRTDGREANSRFSQFCERVWKQEKRERLGANNACVSCVTCYIELSEAFICCFRPLIL
jgi:hypothetical protein